MVRTVIAIHGGEDNHEMSRSWLGNNVKDSRLFEKLFSTIEAKYIDGLTHAIDWQVRMSGKGFMFFICDEDTFDDQENVARFYRDFALVDIIASDDTVMKNLLKKLTAEYQVEVLEKDDKVEFNPSFI